MKKFDYQSAFSALLEKHGAFFAFSDAQFAEKKQEGVEYTGFFGGGVIPVNNAQVFFNELQELSTKQKAHDLANFSKEQLILDELLNHEAFYSWDLTDTFETLNSLYDFTYEDVETVFNANKYKYSE